MNYKFRQRRQTAFTTACLKSIKKLLQARQDSNLQPPVLETGALPIVLLAYYNSMPRAHNRASRGTEFTLSRFRVFGMLAAARTKLVQTQPILHVLFILAGLIVAFLALITCQRQNGLILCSHLI